MLKGVETGPRRSATAVGILALLFSLRKRGWRGLVAPVTLEVDDEIAILVEPALPIRVTEWQTQCPKAPQPAVFHVQE